MSERRIDLPISEIPDKWYNVAADLPTPLQPPRNPVTGQPLTAADMAPLFPMALLAQEMSAERWHEIPDEVREVYKIWRPTPVFRAYALEKALDTPAHIYYKNEGVSPAGSHKPNTAVAQAYYNKAEGINRLTTETGAGQWGASLAMACSMFDMECIVYMVRVSYEQKPYRRLQMKTWGATCYSSPSEQTEFGRKIRAEMPDTPGSLGMAISEAVEDAVKRDDTHYSLGSVLNHVMLHQTVIGLEAKKQMEIAGEYPDVVIACHGGGSNFAGMSFPFAYDKLTQGKQVRIIAAEPTASPTLTRGPLAYDFGDTAGMTPLLRMYTLGHNFVPAPVHAGGLRYHGSSPLVSALLKDKVIEAQAFNQLECYEAAVQFARSESWIPAPETSHAIRCAINQALEAKEAGEKRVILLNWSGHGLLDLPGYDAYFEGKL
ncbi:TrpB-like pyridoxal phosphate-dependent enzyme, partial [bacterium]|nr:TrpB-like pyridoxal phosphate-dependent enzyme [bacterium]